MNHHVAVRLSARRGSDRLQSSGPFCPSDDPRPDATIQRHNCIKAMPPRKSDASKAATGDEGTPVKDVPPREGVNVEVNDPRFPDCSSGGEDKLTLLLCVPKKNRTLIYQRASLRGWPRACYRRTLRSRGTPCWR